MRTTWLIEIRRTDADPWTKQSRARTRREAEEMREAWQARGFQVRVTRERGY